MGFILFGETIYRSFRRLCRGVYNPVGKAGSVGFSEVEQIDAYVPEVSFARGTGSDGTSSSAVGFV